MGNVRTYLKNLSTPFSDNALSSWVAAQKIADQVYDDANRPEDEVAFRWSSSPAIILGLSARSPMRSAPSSATCSISASGCTGPEGW